MKDFLISYLIGVFVVGVVMSIFYRVSVFLLKIKNKENRRVLIKYSIILSLVSPILMYLIQNVLFNEETSEATKGVLLFFMTK